MAQHVMRLDGHDQLFAGRSLTETGDYLGNNNAIGDYSGTPTEFYYTAQPGEHLHITHLQWAGEANGQFRGDGFANINGGLTNGITFWYFRETEKHFLSNPLDPIKNNNQIVRLFDEVRYSPFTLGPKQGIGYYNIYERAETTLYLDGDAGDKFVVLLNDDFTDMLHHEFHISGYRHVKAAGPYSPPVNQL